MHPDFQHTMKMDSRDIWQTLGRVLSKHLNPVHGQAELAMEVRALEEALRPYPCSHFQHTDIDIPEKKTMLGLHWASSPNSMPTSWS